MALKLAIVGAGMGGLTLAAALRQRGIEARIYEQAKGFVRLGAGIQMSPNAMRVLRGIGLEPRIRATAFQPRSWTNRDWDSGKLTNELPLGAEAEAKYGAPYLLMHRGDLHEALVSRVPADQIALDKKLVDLDWRSGGVTLRFADGSKRRGRRGGRRRRHPFAGARSLARRRRQTNTTGRVAYRTTFPAALLQGYAIDQCCKWWGPDRHIVIYYVTANRDEVYFVTSVPEPEFTVESWSATGDLGTAARSLRRLPRAGPARRARLPERAQMGDRRPRSPAPLGRRPDGAARRRRASDDAIHGAGRGDRDGGRGRAQPLHRGAAKRHPGGVCALRQGAPRAHRAHPGHLAAEHLHAPADQPGLGLRLRRLERAAARIRLNPERLSALGKLIRCSRVMRRMDPQRIIELLSRIAFASASVVLMAMSFGLVVYGGVEVITGLWSSWADGGAALLAAIGYVVIAMAVFDVAKYFVEEEVIRGREMRNAAEARRSLTKFISTISIAVFIEGLVLVFRVSKESISDILYPTALLITAIVIVVGLGGYQRLSAEVEQKVEKGSGKAK